MNTATIKNDLNKTMERLSVEDLSELYFESRKKALKHLNYGEIEKSYNEILKGDRLYHKNASRDDKRLFHKAHHRYLEYNCTYDHFKYFRALLMAQNTETYGFTMVLAQLKRFKKELKNKGIDSEDLINFIDNEYEREYKYLKKSVSVLVHMQHDLMQMDYFKEHNYFEDIDPFGCTIEDLETERYNKIAGEIIAKINSANDTKIKKLEQSIKTLRD